MVLKKEEIDPIMEKAEYSYIGDKLSLVPENKRKKHILILVNNELRIITSVFIAFLLVKSSESSGTPFSFPVPIN